MTCDRFLQRRQHPCREVGGIEVDRLGWIGDDNLPSVKNHEEVGVTVRIWAASLASGESLTGTDEHVLDTERLEGALLSNTVGNGGSQRMVLAAQQV